MCDRNNAHFIGDFSNIGEAKHLETAGIGKNGAIPAHEAMQSAQFSDEFITRSKRKMIGITEQNLRADRAKLFGSQTLDSPLSSHRHENGSVNDTMRCFELTEPGAVVGFSQGKREWSHSLLVYVH